ncbi:unnamed protein product [Cylindrotheca closterium]|uniref:Uncharacterized protein n=1 Tax=Cylindrotheca closterium TaxID=2856 RepID=A0AAD2JJ78_9STRA|nr:unnamed protein product [Cylindrotheca closterium]
MILIPGAKKKLCDNKLMLITKHRITNSHLSLDLIQRSQLLLALTVYRNTSFTQLFCQFGFPQCLIPDNAKTLTQGKFREVANEGQVPIHPIEPHHPNQALTEDTIWKGSRLYRRFMHARNIPIAFCDQVLCMLLRFAVTWHWDLQYKKENGEPQLFLATLKISLTWLILLFGIGVGAFLLIAHPRMGNNYAVGLVQVLLLEQLFVLLLLLPMDRYYNNCQ